MAYLRRSYPFVRGFRKGFHLFGESIAILINSILLTMVYIVGVGLTSLLMIGKRSALLDKRLDPKLETYWKERPQDEDELNNSYKQF